MAYYNTDVGLDYSTEEDKIKRALALAQSLRKTPEAQMSTSPGFTSAVTGTRVAMPSAMPSKLAQYAPLLGGIGGNLLENQQFDKQAELNKLKAQGLEDYVRGGPKPSTGAINPGEILEGEEPVQGPIPVTDQQRLEYAAKGAGSTNPLIRDTATKQYQDLTIQEPVREEQRAERLQAQENKNREAALQRMTLLQTKKNEIESRLEQIRLRAALPTADAQAANALRYEKLRLEKEKQAHDIEYDGLKLEVSRQNANTKRDKAAGGGGVKRTEAGIDKQIKAAGNISGLNNVLESLTDSMFNPLKHSERTQMVGARSTDPQDQKDSAAWAQYRSIASELRNTLYGSALTAHEQRAFDATSIDTMTGKEQAKLRLERMLDLAKVGMARKNAMLKNGEFVAETGEVIMPDGTIAPGTKSTYGPGGEKLKEEKPKALPRTAAAVAATTIPKETQVARDLESRRMIQSEVDADVKKRSAATDPAEIAMLDDRIATGKRELSRLPGAAPAAPGGVSEARKAELAKKYGL